MLDQSFSLQNLREIYDIQNRKGVNIAEKFFPTIDAANNLVSNSKKDLRRFKKSYHFPLGEKAQQEKEMLDKKVAEFEHAREEEIEKELDSISKAICTGDFPVMLKKITSPKGGLVYTITPDRTRHAAQAFFAIKQLQRNIEQVYNIRQSNRDAISRQLALTLDNSFPKILIRADVQSFYESIPRASLLQRIAKEGILTIPSQKVLRRILNDYGRLTGKPIGLPRGVGISAHLSELFMRDIDSAIKYRTDVIYYARYVDDIVVVFTADGTLTASEYWTLLSALFEKEGLKLHQNAKQSILTLPPTTASKSSFDYLGYEYDIDNKATSVAITTKRFKRYRRRVRRTFKAYNRCAPRSESNARALLVKRIRFLTGNTHLCNNKSRARVGIYFSNSQITDTTKLSKLDDYLKAKVLRLALPRLRERLKRYEFLSGFQERRYSSFTLKDLTAITKAWRYA